MLPAPRSLRAHRTLRAPLAPGAPRAATGRFVGPRSRSLRLPRLLRLLSLASSLCVLAAAGTGPARAQELYYVPPDGGADSLALEYVLLAWGTNDCAGAQFEICAIRTANGSGPLPPSPRFVFDNSGGDPADSVASNVAMADGYVYWLSKGGELLRRYYTRAIGPPQVISTMATPGAEAEIAADDTHVYWVENSASDGTLYRAPLGGGPREFVMASPDGPATDLQVDGAGRVYFVADQFVILNCCEAVLHQLEPDGLGGFTLTYAPRAFTDGYVVDEDEVFTAYRLTAGGDLLLASAPATSFGSGATWVDLYNAGSSGPPTIEHLALSEDDVFWHEQRPAGGSSILRMPRGGGAPIAITLPVGEARDLGLLYQQTETWLFWREFGAIYRASATGGPITRDLDADDIDLEVVQVTQDSLGSVPLTEGKRTHVRVFARLASSSDAATRLDLFPAVTLSGTRSGVALPDSPLRPIDRLQPILDDDVQRDKTDNQFLFRLPDSWVEGTVELTARVDPQDVIFETDETNNTTTRTVTFDSIGGICIDIIPVRTTNGVEAGGSLATRARTFDRARTLLPTDDLVWIFRGGSPKSKPWSGDVYDFGQEDDAHELMFNWFFDFSLSPEPSQCGGRRTVRTAVVSSAARFGISSPVSATIMYLQTVDGGLVTENVPIGGVSGLAHELGHQLGQDHIGCPLPGMDDAPAFPDGSYPYPPCALDNVNEHIGLDAISRKIIVPYDDMMNPQRSDFMSYNDVYWVSDYVYTGHHSELASATPSPPVGGGGSLVVGGYQIEGSPVELQPGYNLDPGMASVAATRIGASTVPSSELFVRIYDVNGDLEVDEPVYASPTEGEQEGDKNSVSFVALVEYQPDYEKVEIVDALSNVLATANAGASPPSVVITSPVTGAPLGDTVNLSWTGFDADPQDELEYRLFYTHDGGATWQDVLATRATAASVEMVSMPTGSNVQFRVIVSDGIHSSDDSVGPFAVANRAPEVAIFTDDLEEPGGSLSWEFGQANALRGYGYDSDDGPLVGASLSWSVVGPASVAATGERIALADLVPGDYLVELTATDGVGAFSVASLQLHVAPRAIVEIAEEPTPLILDGQCQDAAYAADAQRMVLRYESGELAEIGAAEVGDHVYFCFSGLPRSQIGEYVELRLDPDASADAQMQNDDFFVRLYRDGLIESGVGDGVGGDKLEPVALGAVGAVDDSGPNAWQAELRLDDTLVDVLFGLGALHDLATGDDAVWPEPLIETVPASWAPVQFAPEPGAATGLLAGLGTLCSLARRRSRRRARV